MKTEANMTFRKTTLSTLTFRLMTLGIKTCSLTVKIEKKFRTFQFSLVMLIIIGLSAIELSAVEQSVITLKVVAPD